MAIRLGLLLSLAASVLFAYLISLPLQACCPAPRFGSHVVNADQSVIILWDAENKVQHFIRRASFKTEADDFGFLVPSPQQPELEESGNDAFTYLGDLTKPEIVNAPLSRGVGCGCSVAMRDAAPMAAPGFGVKVLEEKVVAGFQAAVLETRSTVSLVSWLRDNGYAFSPEIEAWAKPYVEAGWKITALKIAKNAEARDNQKVTATALRMSFKTDRPLFPYREPDYKNSASTLNAHRRLLRIYFLAEVRYQGEMTKDTAWTGKAVWAGKIAATDRTKILELLKLPAATGPDHWWLTEFEDDWQYRLAPTDVYFSRDANQQVMKRPPVTQYVAAPYPTDGTAYAFIGVVAIPPLWRLLRHRFRRRGCARR